MKLHICYKCEDIIYPGQAYGRSAKGEYHKTPDCADVKIINTEAPLVFEGDARFHSPNLPRLLGSLVIRTEVDRQCCDCKNYDRSWIFAGEECLREVWKEPRGDFWEKKSSIWVKFKHYPECPIPFDDYDAEAGSAEIIVMKKKASSRPSSLRKVA